MADKAEQRIRSKHAHLDWLAQEQGLSQVLSTYEGRRFMWWLIGEGRVFHNAFTSNALSTSYNCGVQEVGQKILSRIIAHDPQAYVRMFNENADLELRIEAEVASEKERTDED